ncbi:hypothetical protein NPIL_299101 [Nephila pilipes]|uniref:Uncharacterized protein n=1 Tax=Nephila pilipes TaxID=299642 RepID=A0A8X6SYW9_NEPPI|nr:hypothetical protein NPIL_299101 [Nephila pilipes]
MSTRCLSSSEIVVKTTNALPSNPPANYTKCWLPSRTFLFSLETIDKNEDFSVDIQKVPAHLKNGLPHRQLRSRCSLFSSENTVFLRYFLRKSTTCLTHKVDLILLPPEIEGVLISRRDFRSNVLAKVLFEQWKESVVMEVMRSLSERGLTGRGRLRQFTTAFGRKNHWILSTDLIPSPTAHRSLAYRRSLTPAV